MENETMRVLGAAASPNTLGAPGTPSTPTPTSGSPSGAGHSSDANGRNGGGAGMTRGPAPNPSMAGLPQDSKTREEILRERYQKGLRKRKCTVCGNTARARCPYSSCKTCCSKAKNPCHVHVLKQSAKKAANSPSPSMSTPPQSEQAWLAQNLSPATGSGYLRSGFNAPSPYNSSTPNQVGSDRGGPPLDASAATAKKSMASGNRSWGSSPLSEQQELQRQRALQAAAQKEAILANAWRLQKLREHTAGEMLAEDEAFDRYMKNASLMEEVFSVCAQEHKGTKADGRQFSEDESRGEGPEFDVQNGTSTSLFDGVKARMAADLQRKESSRKKLNHIIEKAIRKLRTANQEHPEVTNGAEEDDAQHLLGRRRGSKRLKSLTEEGKTVLKTMQSFDVLLEKVKTIKDPEDIQMCMDLYNARLGGNLTYLIPNLYPREVAESRNGSGSIERGLEEAGPPKVPEDSAAIAKSAPPLNHLISALSEPSASGLGGSDNPSAALGLHDTGRLFQDVKERPWNTPAGKLERLHWHRDYCKGISWWKVYAHDDTLRNMCFERANANTTILEL